MKVIKFLDAIYYIAAQVGIIVAAAHGSVPWTLACGFMLIDGAYTILWEQANNGRSENKEDNT